MENRYVVKEDDQMTAQEAVTYLRKIATLIEKQEACIREIQEQLFKCRYQCPYNNPFGFPQPKFRIMNEQLTSSGK